MVGYQVSTFSCILCLQTSSKYILLNLLFLCFLNVEMNLYCHFCLFSFLCTYTELKPFFYWFLKNKHNFIDVSFPLSYFEGRGLHMFSYSSILMATNGGGVSANVRIDSR